MDTVKIGWGRREISIDEPVLLSGQMYLRISEGIQDPLYVTALCVDGGKGMDAVVFLSCDVGALGGNTLKPTEELVRQACPDFPENGFIANATHTHSASGVGGTMEVTPDGVPVFSGVRFREFYIRQCADAIIEAWQNRKAGGIGYGYGFAVVAHSRRVVYFEEKEKLAKRDFMTPAGYAVMYGNTNHELFSHYEAGADHFVNLMFTFDENEKLTGMVVNVPCPSQLSEHFVQQSSDYWHDVRAQVAKEFGPDVYVLTQCAAAGDLSPRTLHYKQAQARRMELKYGMSYDPKNCPAGSVGAYNKSMTERYDIAERLIACIKDVYGWAKKEIFTQIPVRHHYDIMQLQRRVITEDEKRWCEENLEILADQEPKREEMTPEEYRTAISYYNNKVNRNKGGIERYHDVKENPTLKMGAHVVQIGDIAFATTRFELYQDFMHRLQARSPFIQTFVVQLAGEEGCNYLATKRAAAAKGYSASMFCNMVSADGGHQWVENCLEILKDMKAKDEQ